MVCNLASFSDAQKMRIKHKKALFLLFVKQGTNIVIFFQLNVDTSIFVTFLKILIWFKIAGTVKLLMTIPFLTSVITYNNCLKMVFQKELDCAQEYFLAQSDRGNISYNISKDLLHIWHYHNGECTPRKAQNFLIKLTNRYKLKKSGGRTNENDSKIRTKAVDRRL